MQTEIEALFDNKPASYTEAHYTLFSHFKAALNNGSVRAAEPDATTATGWRVNAWVKKGILLGMRLGTIVDMSIDAFKQPFFDKHTWPVKHIAATDGVRIVPGGSSIRDGSYIGKGVICMPPMYINVGAWVDDGTMVDSHALVGSCAQVGKNCHISAAAQIGGVLEPVGAMPVIIEDDVLMGGNCGVYEGTVVKRRAVLGSGVILTRSTPVYDVVRNQVLTATDDAPLVIPEDAVVVPGSRKEKETTMKDKTIAVFRDPNTKQLIEITNVGDACRILQRELALRAQRRSRRDGFTYKSLAAKAGCCNSTLYKIADGTTKWPQLRTCLLIFHAIGAKVYVEI